MEGSTSGYPSYSHDRRSKIKSDEHKIRSTSNLRNVQESTKTTQNKNILNLTKLGHIFIKVEPQKTSTTLPQCHRSQNYRYSQDSCNQTPRRAKWGHSHFTNLCQKPLDTSAAAKNCGDLTRLTKKAIDTPQRPNQFNLSRSEYSGGKGIFHHSNEKKSSSVHQSSES